jgi:hypothetical protein
VVRRLRISRPTPLTGWGIVLLGSAVMVVDLTGFGDVRLLPGGLTAL